MIVGLQIGKETSTGRPGKNYMNLIGRQMNEYSLLAAKNCPEIERIYISTDSPSLKKSGIKFGAKIINRPPELALPTSLTEDVLTHALESIVSDIGEEPELIVLLFANTPTVDSQNISKAIDILRKDSTLDSCFSFAKYDMFSPTRAKKISESNIVMPFVDQSVFEEVSSLRNSQGSVYFADLTIQVLRPVCIKNIDNGTPPLKWMGSKTYGLKVDYGFDLDEEWQIPVLEHWLKNHGFTMDETPYDKLAESK